MSTSLRLRLVPVLLTLLITGLLGACGGTGGDAGLQSEIKDVLMDNDGLTETEADCVSRILVEDVDDDVLRRSLETSDPDIPEGAINAMDRALNECFNLDDLPTDEDTEPES